MRSYHAYVVLEAYVGYEYSALFATLGADVTLIDQSSTLLDFVDREIVNALTYHLRSQNVTLRMGEGVEKVCIGERDRIVIELASGKRRVAETLLCTLGRRGATDDLHLEAAGLHTDCQGRLQVNAAYQTAMAHIYAAGDVIGFPSLAGTSMEQRRVAAQHALGLPAETLAELAPFSLWTIPAISMIGKTEDQLTQARLPYEVGLARYKEIAQGLSLGDDTGMLKLLFQPRHIRSLRLTG